VKLPRYIIWSFLKTLFLLLLALMFVFVLIDFIGNIRQWASRENSEIIEYYWAYLPYIVYLVTPVALLISVIVAIGSMAKHLEFAAIQAAGRSPLVALMPVFLVTVLVVLFSWWLSEKVLPNANHRRLEIMQTAHQQKKNARVKHKTDFVFIDSERVSWFFKYYSASNRTGRDVVLLLRQDGELVERYDAKEIQYQKTEEDSGWVLKNGFHRQFMPDGSIEVQGYESKSLADKVKTHPEDLINERQTGDEMDSKMILHRIEVLKRSGEDTKVFETAYHFKFSGPWMNLIVVLIGASICHRFSRSAGLSQKFAIGVLLVFIYYILIRVSLKMGENGALSPFFSAWVAHYIFGAVAIIMLYRSFRL
jgi:lipopolysaccharide export system permease protein